MKQLLSVLALIISLCSGYVTTAQQLSLPRESQSAMVSQTVGSSVITINYSRPAVKGRIIWGKLVPYGFEENAFGNGKPMPWRAGANENTVITFSHDVKLNGVELKAGSYGLHMIPAENKEWTIIFSKDYKAWGSFFYEKENDALRITASPEKSNFSELLTYGFDNIKASSARAYLTWENLLIGFTCEFEADKITLESIRTQLTGAGGFNWQSWNQAAIYCLQSGKWLELGEQWCNKSIALNENSTNRNTLGYLLMAQKKTDEALKLFKENTDRYPADWNVWDSYGEALATAGRKSEAIDYYKKALEIAPKGQAKRIEKAIKDISN